MTKSVTIQDIDAHYTRRHELRKGLFEGKPYANYGYWTRADMTISEACDALTDLMGRELELGPGDRLLECGCGYGASAAYLAQTFHPREIRGIDATALRIETGRKLVEGLGLADTINLSLGDATHLDFPDASFDKVLAIECAFHFHTRETFFHEAFRVLRPGGILAMTDIVLDPSVDPTEHTLEDLCYFLCADQKYYDEANICGAATCERQLRGAGFTQASVRSIKDRVILQFADYLDSVAERSAPDMQARRRKTASEFRDPYMKFGDYVVVRARK